MPRVSIVTPTRGRARYLARLIASLERQEEGDFELIVASDAEDPQAPEVSALAAYSKLDTIHVRAALPGAAAARNAAAAEARTTLLLFLDDDVIAAPGLVAEHLRVHSAEPAAEVGVLGRVSWAGELRVTPFMRWVEHGIQFDHSAIAGEEAGWGRFYTINASVKRELFDRVRGFDEARFPFHYEDIELARRMQEHGFRLLYAERAAVEHLHAVELEGYKERMRAVGAAERRFARLYPELQPDLHARFTQALELPPSPGRLAPLLGRVPRGMPVLGERVWWSADVHFRQQLAPYFLEGWDSESPAGSPPGGP